MFKQTHEIKLNTKGNISYWGRQKLIFFLYSLHEIKSFPNKFIPVLVTTIGDAKIIVRLLPEYWLI